MWLLLPTTASACVFIGVGGASTCDGSGLWPSRPAAKERTRQPNSSGTARLPGQDDDDDDSGVVSALGGSAMRWLLGPGRRMC